jgi:hypothetical protein
LRGEHQQIDFPRSPERTLCVSKLNRGFEKEQYDQLSARAERAGVPTSALAREVILASLGDADGDRVAAKLEEVLRRTLSPDLLAS